MFPCSGECPPEHDEEGPAVDVPPPLRDGPPQEGVRGQPQLHHHRGHAHQPLPAVRRDTGDYPHQGMWNGIV